MDEFEHVSVMLSECISELNIKQEGIYVDLTAGGGGHSIEIAKKLDFNKGRLICFDRDKEAVAAAMDRLSDYRAEFINDNFSAFSEYMDKKGIDKIAGAIMDLGVSSHQLDSVERGFSFREDAPLDMRMSREGLSAYDVVNTYGPERLIEILFKYGEEKYARGIVNGIIKHREADLIKTTGELAEIIKNNVPLKVRRDKNPCRKTFQAIRIEVNGELTSVSKTIPAVFERLESGGRLCVISFHSLEDRIVKNLFKEFSTGCICPSDFPVCVCGKTPRGKLITKKPFLPSEEEVENNPRSRSAKLRIISKI
ncbi:MAG: 16S rRNA (cytosine(1402)-N(4))-methyltransferase RsmH [Eubacterium sp.]|jgi:16S rRNA (cytosine1402-N4)-methyltransferase|nr:16S rRNA (cytosine(1402)-N(4))-methyltransferase RsmH [Eubacterium sp.]